MDQPIEILTRADVVVRYKATFSLIALWIFAVIVVGIMVLFNSSSIKANTIGREVLLHISQPLAEKHAGLSSFNIEKSDKKFFLTRLQSSQQLYDKKPAEQTLQVLIIRKSKTGTGKKNEGFQIKPLPK